MFGNGRCRIFNGVCESPRLFAHDASAATSPNKKIMICSRDEQQSEACTLRARREGLVAKPGSSVVALDDPVREEQVLEESVMHIKDNARSPQAEPVRTRISDGLKFSPFSSRRKIPSIAKSEGGELRKYPPLVQSAALPPHHHRHSRCPPPQTTPARNSHAVGENVYVRSPPPPQQSGDEAAGRA